MVGEYHNENWGEVLEFEKMLAQDFGDSGERGMVGEIYGAWERLNGRAEEMTAAVVVEMEVYSAAYGLMAGAKGDHSFSKKTVEREETLGEVL